MFQMQANVGEADFYRGVTLSSNRPAIATCRREGEDKIAFQLRCVITEQFYGHNYTSQEFKNRSDEPLYSWLSDLNLPEVMAQLEKDITTGRIPKIITCSFEQAEKLCNDPAARLTHKEIEKMRITYAPLIEEAQRKKDARKMRR